MASPAGPDDARPRPRRAPGTWWRTLRDPALGLGTRLTLFVLLAGLGLSAFLLYQTVSTQQSHREAVSRGLENVSVLVADRVMVPVMGDWYMASSRALEPLRLHLASGEPGPMPGPDILSAEELIGGNCECSLAPAGATAFRMDLASGELLLEEEGSPAPAAHALRARLRAAAEIPVTDTTYAHFNRRPGLGMVLVDGPSRPHVATFALLLEADDTPRWAYGFTVPADEFLSGSVASLMDLAPRLLPRELRSPPEIPVLASAALVTADGEEVLARAETHVAPGTSPGPTTLVAGFQQWSVLDEVRLQASLHPEFLAWIPVPESADDRTLLYGLLLVLNAGLVGIALVQLRRESAFLRKRAEFVAGFSHEARNPLATIRLYAQGLRFGRISADAARDRALDIIDRESRRLVHMVSNFLSHGAHEEGALRLTPHPVEVTDELRTFAASARSELRERKARLALEVDGPTWIHADPTALQQVLRNLVGNALKYGPDEQTIRLGAERANGAVSLYVEDEGPGIPDDELEAVFEPFVRTPAAIRSGAGGSGLGLSVVRELVTLQGGRVHIEAGRTGHGARFVVRFPAQEEDTPAPTNSDTVAPT
jgi:signal transduction histidine kinase